MSTPATLEPEMVELSTFGDPSGLEDSHYEIVHGRRRELPPMGIYSVTIASRLTGILFGFTSPRGLGEVVTKALFRLPLAEDQQRNRRPDVAFVSYQRWPADRPMSMSANAWDVVPDLAVEVVSPNDLAEELIDKLHDYFRAGVRLVWVLFPKPRQVYIYESPTSVRILTDAESLDGGAVLNGFTLPLVALFDPSARPPTV